MDDLDLIFENIVPWNGEVDTGRDARLKLDRNFARIKNNFEAFADGLFINLGGIPEDEFDNITKPGYYLYAIQAGSGEIKGILVVSKDGFIRQIRYEFNGMYIRSFTDEGWEEWEDQFVLKLRKHIDNDSIYWDGNKRVIKSKGGGGSEIFTITVDADETSGVRGEILPAKVNKVQQGDSLTITIVPKTGFVVQRVNVDKVSQGAITEYTFRNVQEDHTMYVWFQAEVAANPTDWLERSDLPGTYYSSLQAAFDALKADYPEKLTKDITITCVKDGIRFKRDRNLWLAEIINWNKGSMFTLTVDGANKLTLDCASVGGLNFDHVDNIIVKNTAFVNVANYMESSAPEEVSGVNFTGNVESYSRNLYVADCTINGLSPVNKNGLGRYAIIGKYAENMYVNGCRITEFNCIPLKFMDCRIVSLIKSYIDASHSYGLIGHPALCTMSNSQILIAEDNEFTGTSGEYFFYLTNVEHIFFRRNYFHDGNGEGIKIASRCL